MTQWVRSHVLQITTAVLASLLVSAVVGTWSASVEFQRLQERIDQRDQQYMERFESDQRQIDRLRARVLWLEQNRGLDDASWVNGSHNGK